jgi:VCBS repeat-containing protein
MAIRRLRSSISKLHKARKKRLALSVERDKKRSMQLEKLEDRRVLAGGPILVGLQTSDGDLVRRDGTTILDIAPATLKLRFDGNQRFAPNSTQLNQSIRVTRGGADGLLGTADDVRVIPGFIGPGSAPNENEIILRFAETLPDDVYQLQIFAKDNVPQGIAALRNLAGDAFMPTDALADRESVRFELDLGAQIISVVPQPLARDANNRLIQQDDVILVYLNNDDLFDQAVSFNPAVQNPTVVDPRFYQLIATKDTVSNNDDVVFRPTAIDYDPVTDTVKLRFAQPLYDLLGDPTKATTFRLRIGTDEAAPGAPVRVDARAAGSPKNDYQIDLRFPDASVPAELQQIIRRAADRIQQIVVGDLSNEGMIDDLEITVLARTIDGVGGNIAVGFPTNLRNDTKLPFQAQINIDTFDLIDRAVRDYPVASLEETMQREILHAMGFGTLWQQKNLVTGIGSANPRYLGPRALAEFNAHFNVASTSVPVENLPDREGVGLVVGQHWREEFFEPQNFTPPNLTAPRLRGELMTGFLNYTWDANLLSRVSEPNLISRVTIASLADLGYIVDLDAADEYRGVVMTVVGNGAAFPDAATLTIEDARGVVRRFEFVDTIINNGQSDPNAIPILYARTASTTAAQMQAAIIAAINNLNATSAFEVTAIAGIGNRIHLLRDRNVTLGSGLAAAMTSAVQNLDPPLPYVVPQKPLPDKDPGSSFKDALSLVPNFNTGTADTASLVASATIDPRFLGVKATVIRVTANGNGQQDGSSFTVRDVAGNVRKFEFVDLTLANGQVDPAAIPVNYRSGPGVTVSTPEAIATAIAAAISGTAGPFSVEAKATGTTVFLNKGNLFLTHANSVVFSGNTLGAKAELLRIGIDMPGAINEPGHRQTDVEEHIRGNRTDFRDEITTLYYNFKSLYGFDANNNPLLNVITNNQRQRAREVLEVYGRYLGVQFVETADRGLTIATGDPRAVRTFVPTGPGQPLGISGGGVVVMDNAEPWNDDFGGNWFQEAMEQIGHALGMGHSFELPHTIMGNDNGPTLGYTVTAQPEPIFPGDHDIVHGRQLFRPQGQDIDMYRFDLVQSGLLTLETFAERLPNSSLLDTVLKLYKVRTDAAGNTLLDVHGDPIVDQIARNDNYFSKDSFLELELGTGTYYVGVTSTGNEDYDPRIEDSGMGGTSEGDYELRMVFRPQSDKGIVDFTRTRLDGDLDGVPGGVYNYWFRAAPPLSTTSITNPTLAATIYVDKANQPPVGAPPPDGRRTNPFNTIPAALNFINSQRQVAPATEYLVRIVGNGGDDKDVTTLRDNIPYEIGFRPPFNQPLPDGSKLDVPKNVTVMIDAGAIFKNRESSINVGSEAPTIDRSGGAVQILGAPFTFDRNGNVIRDASGKAAPGSVYFTSWNDETLGADTNPAAPQTPISGDWGGIIVRGDHDSIEARKNYEREGLFLNYVNHADMRFGGGKVVVNSVQQSITPVHMIDARPTATFNTITLSAQGAMSADPDAFRISNFHDPASQFLDPFTLDYERVGPDIYGNRLVNNSTNGLSIRIQTLANNDVKPQVVTGRWDDTDIVHVLTENLVLQGSPGGPFLELTAPPVTLVRFSAPPPGQFTGTLTPAATYRYRVTFVDRNGNESLPSKATPALTDNPNLATVSGNGVIQINNLPQATGNFVGRRIYRSQAGGAGPFELVARINASDTTYVDRGEKLRGAGGILDTTANDIDGLRRPRLSAGLVVDPGTVVKLEGSRIHVGVGANFLAEGQDGREIIFTARQDDRYGGSGTFDTNADDALGVNEAQPRPGSWGGIYLGANSTGSLDHVLITYGGGIVKGGGSFFATNAVEIHQAKEARITNSVIERNEIGQGGQSGQPTSTRFGLGFNAPAAIFVRGAQPIIVNNIIRDNLDLNNVDFNPNVTQNVAAININVNALNSDAVRDHGRATGLGNAFTGFRNNYGPLIRENNLFGNSLNGMVVRGGLVTTQGVFDDTDIVHIVFEEIVIPDFHTFGGLRLQSSPTESLVVKLSGANAGFTATGTPLDIDDRIGGALHVVGQPGFPVVLTSLADDTVGAGFDPLGDPQTDTNNDGNASSPQRGSWRSLKIDQYAHDRNVDLALELEPPDVKAPGPNATPNTAQFLGDLAPHEKAGDDNRRLGFVVYGYLSDLNDLDVYSFTADPGTEVWFDIDRSYPAVDTVLELLDASGRVIARSDNSLAESAGLQTIYEDNPPNTDIVQANSMPKSLFQPKDHWSTNVRDAGFRVVLPGEPNPAAPPTYFVRVRSSNLRSRDPRANLDNPAGLLDGLTEGVYQLQVRLRELDEIPGSTVRFADIRYATNGVELIGQPTHSPLLGEAVEILNPAQTDDVNNSFTGSQYIGDLLNNDRAVISLAGTLGIPARPGFAGVSGFTDVDFYRFDLNYSNLQSIFGAVNPLSDPLNNPVRHVPLTFDVDYADGFSRANVYFSVFDGAGRLIYNSNNSNIADDQPQPLNGSDVDDISRGTNGILDPFIGPVELKVPGTYYIAVSSIARIPAVLDQFFTANATDLLTRLEPIPSVRRIVEDHVDVGESPRQVIVDHDDNMGLLADQFIPPQTSTTQTVNRLQLPGGNNIAGFAPTFVSGSQNVVPHHLGNVVLYVSEQGPGTRTGRLKTINPFTGHEETIVGIFGEDFGDIAINPATGQLGGFSVDIPGRTDTNTGVWTIVDTGTAAIVSTQDDGILTFHHDPAIVGNEARSNNGAGFGYEFEAIAIPPTFVSTAAAIYGVGSRFFSPFSSFGQTNVEYDNNILYHFNADGTATSLGPNRAGGAQHRGAGTQIVEAGELLTFTEIQPGNVVAGATYTITIPATGQSVSFTATLDDLPGNPQGLQQVVTGLVTAWNAAATAPANRNRPGIASFTATQRQSPDRGRVKPGGFGVGSPFSVPYAGTPSYLPVLELRYVDQGDAFGYDANPNPAINFPLQLSVTNGGLGAVFQHDGGLGPGGEITGLSFVGGSLYAVSDQGGMWQVTNYDSRLNAQTQFVANIFDTTVVEPQFSPRSHILHPRMNFEALTSGPVNVEGGKYSSLLFAMDNIGQMVSVNPEPFASGVVIPGQLEPVFFDNQTVLHTTTYGTVTGMEFSNLDYNLWHLTGSRGTNPGHGVNPSPDGSRLGAAGGLSLWFGHESPGANGIATNPSGSAGTYNFPGGAYGAIVSDPFSLTGYSSADQPSLYFNYFLNTEDRAYQGPYLAPQSYFTDSFRVFVSDDNGNWELLGTNNQFDAGTSEYDFGARTGSYRAIQEFYDNTGWRQAKIPLDKYAGRDNLRLRFEFHTAADTNIGDPLTTGDELRALPGTTLRDGQSVGLNDWSEFEFITNNLNRLEVDLGYTLVLPSGAKINDGDTFEVDGVRYEFDDDDLDGIRGNNYGNGIDEVGGSLVLIPFHRTMTAEQVATRVQIAVETNFVARNFNKRNTDDFGRAQGGIQQITVNGDGNTFTNGAVLTVVDPLGNTFNFSFRSGAPAAGTLDYTTGLTPTTTDQMAREIADEINAAGILDLMGNPARAVVNPSAPPGRPFASVLLPRDFSIRLGASVTGVISQDSTTVSNDTLHTANETGLMLGAGVYTVQGRIGDNPNLQPQLINGVPDPRFTRKQQGRDVDVYRIQVNERSRIQIDIDTGIAGGARNAIIALLDANGNVVVDEFFNYVGIALTDFINGIQTASIDAVASQGQVDAVNPPQHSDPPQPRNGFPGVAFPQPVLRSDPGFVTPAGVYYVVVSGGINELNPLAIPGNLPRELDPFTPGYVPFEEGSGGIGTQGLYDLRITVSNADAPPTITAPVTAPATPQDRLVHGDDRLSIDHPYTFLNTHRDGNRVNVPYAISVTSSVFVGAPNTPFARVIEGGPGVFPGIDTQTPTIQPNIPIRIHAGMTAEQVATQIQYVMADTYHGGDIRDVKVYRDIVRLIGHQINSNDLAPLGNNIDALGLQKFGVAGRFNNSWMPGDSTFNPASLTGTNNPFPGSGTGFGYFEASTTPNGAVNRAFPGALRAQRNNFEGVYIDDIIVGFAERGEMVTGTTRTAPTLPNSGFILNPHLPDSHILDGPYQVEIRRSTDFGLSLFPPHNAPTSVPELGLYRAFDTNARFTHATSLVIPAGNQIFEGQTFTLSDGVNSLTFEYDDLDLGNGVAAGRVQIGFRDFEKAELIARRVRDAINSPQVQDVLKITAATSDGNVSGVTSTSNVINLFGNAVGGVPGNVTVQDYDAYDFGDVQVIAHGVAQQERFLDGRVVRTHIEHGFLGDANHFRDQGQILVHSNTISLASNHAIRAEAGVRAFNSNFPGSNFNNNPHPGPVRVFSELNDQRLVPGVTLTNNLIVDNGQGGIFVGGDPVTFNAQAASIPFARVVNNTLYGRGPSQTNVGIDVRNNASPTLLNNIVSNFSTGILVDASSASTVISGTLYKTNLTPANTPVGVGDFAINLDLPTEPNKALFVDPAAGVFYLAAGSRAIDSSVASLNDRFDLVRVRDPLGIPRSPILAPERDLTGQLRVDDPTISTPSGQGENTFKDRGALDRSDLDGPTAQITLPRDNDADRLDIDPAVTVVQRPTGVFSRFEIQLNDGRGGTSLIDGIGVDARTVLPNAITVTRNGQFLLQGVDYSFSYNTTSRIIRLTPLAGIWQPDSVYVITLNNRDRYVVTAPAGDQVVDSDQFEITDSTGVQVVFEYDSGYTLQVPKTLSVQVPPAGGGLGGITDGSTFTITRASITRTFEFDSNNTLVNSANIRVAFTVADDADTIAKSIADAVRNAGLGLSPKTLGNGIVHIGGTPAHSLDVGTTKLVRDGSSNAVVDGQTFTIDRPNSPLMTFEFDLDPAGDVLPGNIRVPFKLSDTQNDIADTLAAVIQSAGLGLTPSNIGGGRVHVGGTDHTIDTSGSNLVTSGRPGVTSNLRLHVPVQGGGPGGIVDGQSFFVTDGARTVVFEFDDNGLTVAGNTIISINPGGTISSQDAIASLLVTALNSAGFGLTPTNSGNGIVEVGGQARHLVDVTGTTMSLTGVPGGAVPVTFRPTALFAGSEMALAIIRAIDSSSLTNVKASVRGGSTLFIDGISPTSGLINGIPNFFLVGIKDFALNNLQPNQNSQETRFTVLLGDNRVDFGDAPDGSVNPLGQFRYDTTFADNGARHVIFDNNPLFLGRRVDADLNGVPTVLADGDDLEGNGLPLNLAGSPALSSNSATTPLTMQVPETFFIQVPDQGGIALTDGETFRIGDGAQTVVFELDSDNVTSATNVRVPFSPGSTSNDIATAIIDAINLSSLGLTPINLGNGRVHLGSRAIHSLDASTAPGLVAGGVASSVVDGNTFSMTRGGTTVTFEFDNNLQSTLGNRVISIDTRLTHQQLADRIATSIVAANLGVTPILLGNGQINLDGDDEDGVTFDGAFNAFLDTPITVTASSAGLLDAWVDFNRDGDWDDPGEKIFNSVALVAGDNRLFTRTPSTAVAGVTYARFRFSSLGGLSPTGLAEAGEVEDYQVSIRDGRPPIAVNDPAVAGSFTTSEDAILVVSSSVLANDSDPDGDPISINNPGVLTSARGARVTLNADGTFTYDPTVPSAVELQRLTVGAFLNDTFTYRAFDGFLFSNLATVTIRVTGENDAPTTRPMSLSAQEDGPIIGAAFNGDDVDNDDSQSTLLYTIVPGSGPAEGIVQNVGNGQFTFNPNRNIAFQDLALGEQRDVSFRYTATDSHGIVSPEAVVRITVTGVNDAPVAANMLVQATEDGGPVTNLFAGSDVDSDDNQASLVYTIFGTPVEGAIANNGNGSFTFNPGTAFQDLAAGEIRDVSVVYNASDRHGSVSQLGTITIRVTGVNDPPTAVNDPTFQSGYSTTEDVVLNINNAAAGVLANDSDADLNDVLRVQGAPLTVASANGAQVTLFPNGTFTYDPRAAATIQALNLGQSLNDTFVYVVSDGNGGSAQATVTIAVSGRNDRPVANPVLVQAVEDGPSVIGAFQGDDADAEDNSATLIYSIIPQTGPSEGSLANNGNGTFTFNPGTSFQNLRPGQTRDVTVQYQAADRRGSISNPGTITIRVTGKNDAPVAVNDDAGVNRFNSSIIINVLANDTDIDNSPFDTSSVMITQNPSNGTVVVNANGTVTYTSTTGFLGTDSFRYRFKDLEGVESLLSNEATVTVTTTIFPVAQNTLVTTFEGVPITIDVVKLASDADGTINPATVKITGGPANGIATVNRTTGEITYSPNLGFLGSDQIKYTVQDNVGATSNEATIDINVLVNPTPFRNPRNNLDVNADGVVTAFDALLVISFLNRNGSRPPFGPTPPYLDTVPTDNLITPADAAAIIAFLSRRAGNSEGEGGSASEDDSVRLVSSSSPLAIDFQDVLATTSSSNLDVQPEVSVTRPQGNPLHHWPVASLLRQSSLNRLSRLRDVDVSDIEEALDEIAVDAVQQRGDGGDDAVDQALLSLLFDGDYFKRS